jgi:hypothetical protein
VQGEGVAAAPDLEPEALVTGGGATLDGEAQAGALAAQVEVGVAPGVQLGGAVHRLARAKMRGALAGVVEEEDGAVEVALEPAGRPWMRLGCARLLRWRQVVRDPLLAARRFRLRPPPVAGGPAEEREDLPD